MSNEDLVTLADCPIGLFWCGDELCLKTEYGNNEGRIDAYIVSSGEFFWGDAPQTITSQRAQLVRPVPADTLSRPPVDGELVEQVAMELLARRGFGFYSDPMEGGQDAYDISCEALSEAAAIIPLVLEEAAKALSQRAQVYRTANYLERADGLDEGIAIIRNLGRPA